MEEQGQLSKGRRVHCKTRSKYDFPVQVARKFFPLDIDLGGDSDQVQKLSAKDSKSKLPKAVQVTLF